jgi:putative membrane protein
MPSSSKLFLQRWLITTVAVLVAAHIVRGIEYQTVLGLFAASLILGILNAFLRPLMLVLAFPLLIVSFGLFILVINALLLYLVGWLMRPQFSVADFWSAFWGGLVISLVSMAVNALLGSGGARIQVEPGKRPPPAPPRGKDGGGPVIDV